MNLVYPLLPQPICFDENRINVLIIENRQELRRLIRLFQQQTAGAEGELVLSENALILEISRSVLLVTDPFSLDFEGRKLLARINQEACAAGESHAEEFQALMSRINELAFRICSSMDFDAAFEPLENREELIKLLGFHVDTEALSFPELILEYASLHGGLMKKGLFVFYNLKACMTPEELALFYKSALYRKLNILLIEDLQRDALREYEKIRIVDKDLCII